MVWAIKNLLLGPFTTAAMLRDVAERRRNLLRSQNSPSVGSCGEWFAECTYADSRGRRLLQHAVTNNLSQPDRNYPCVSSSRLASRLLSYYRSSRFLLFGHLAFLLSDHLGFFHSTILLAYYRPSRFFPFHNLAFIPLDRHAFLPLSHLSSVRPPLPSVSALASFLSRPPVLRPRRVAAGAGTVLGITGAGRNFCQQGAGLHTLKQGVYFLPSTHALPR